jgi:hypothetical protein
MSNEINKIIRILGILLVGLGWLGTKTFLGDWSWAVIIFGIISIFKGFSKPKKVEKEEGEIMEIVQPEDEVEAEEKLEEEGI